MKRLKFTRIFLLLSAVLLIAGAFIVAAGVIPPVSVVELAGGYQERALTVFWVVAVLSLLVAAALVFLSVRIEGRTRLMTAVLIILALLVLFGAYVLNTAASADAFEAPALRLAAILLSLGSLIDLIAGVLLTVSILLLPRRA